MNDGIKINIINPERTATPMRFENFGNEPLNTLLSPEMVANCTLNTMIAEYTGQIIDVKKTHEIALGSSNAYFNAG